MAGITHVLSVAKEALLTHQLSVQVTSHNVANVDTPGYSRQALGLTTNIASPSRVGNIGNGVVAESIERKYDQFMTQRIMEQSSTMGDLEAKQESLRVVETIFNEAKGLAVNDLMAEFWNSWQSLADNPELSSFRQEVVLKGQLLTQHFQNMNDEIIKTRVDIGIALDNAISDVNSLTTQIADINTRITSSETTKYKANDLRDKRDELLKELSSFVDVSYFESPRGDYTIMLADGHTLVANTEHWEVEWSNNELYWVNVDISGNRTSALVSGKVDIGGKIGGYTEISKQLSENDPDNYLGRLDNLVNALVREVNQQHTQGVGLIPLDTEITGTEVAPNTAHLNTVVDATTATETIAADTFIINDRYVGEIEGALAVQGLAMGKAYNAVEAINNATAGVNAKLTTLVAGTVVDSTTLTGGGGDVFTFDINGVNISYTTVAGDAGVGNEAVFAANVVNAINAAITTYNGTATNPMDVTIQAVVGDGTNGGALNSIVLQNINPGDESRIIIGNIVSAPVGLEANLGLTTGTYTPDATHNNGTISIFSDESFTVEAGTDDIYLTQLGMGGGLHPEDTPDDGKFTYSYDNPGGVPVSLQGFQYANELVTDGGSFDIWLFDSNDNPALPQPVTVSMERAYDLQDVADAINVSITNATGGAPWLTASVSGNRLVIKPDVAHKFAFANDTSNILQVAGINAFFSGYSAGTINVNSYVSDDLNRLAAGQVTSFGEVFRGDNSNALLITDIQQDENVRFTDGTINTLDGYYNTLVGNIGLEGSRAIRDTEYNTQVLNQLMELRDSVSAVSLDEEMANLIKFQHAYSAAAKLITTSDEMLATLIDTVKR